jgi:hypothetical protein
VVLLLFEEDPQDAGQRTGRVECGGVRVGISLSRGARNTALVRSLDSHTGVVKQFFYRQQFDR